MVFLERNTNVLAFRVQSGIPVVPYVTRFGGEDAVVAAEFAVFAGEPRGAALAEDDVAGDHIFACFLSCLAKRSGLCLVAIVFG